MLLKLLPHFCRLGNVILFFGIVVALFMWMVKPNVPTERPNFDSEKVEEAKRLREVELDTENRPRIVQEVNYDEGESADWYPKGEPPLLAPLVDAGELPPIEQRVGSQPVVLEGPDGIGNYGGTWVSYIPNENLLQMIDNHFSYYHLVRYSPQGEPIVPHLATSWEVSEDKRHYTFHLRRGVKWSDGEDWNADDIMYWFEHEFDNRPAGFGIREILRHQGRGGSVKSLDDYTIVISFKDPHGSFLEMLASGLGRYLTNSPEHYRRQYHPVVGDPEKKAELRKLYGLNSDKNAYKKFVMYSSIALMNPDHPRLWPWIPRKMDLNSPYTFVRNPYYFAVDTQGNQLPYIDRLVLQIKTASIIGISSAGGDVALQSEGINYKLYSLLMDQREAGDYRLLHWYSVDRSDLLIMPNINRRIVDEDPTTSWKREFLSKKEFRQALSLAINRQQIIDSQFSGVGEPAQLDPGKDSRFHSRDLYSAFVEHDPERANAMLDALGLNRRDREGYRLFPDGTRAHFFIHFSNTMNNVDTQALQLVADDWGRVGIRASIRPLSPQLWRTEVRGLQHDFSVGSSNNEFYPLLLPRMLAPGSSYSDYAFDYAQWVESGGMFPEEDKIIRGKPIPEGHPLLDAMSGWYRSVRQTTFDDQVATFKAVTDVAKDNLFTISISTPVPRLTVASNQLRNVPELAIQAGTYQTPGNTGFDTFFFENPQTPPKVMDAMRSQILMPDYGGFASDGFAAESESGSSGNIMRTILRAIILLILICVLALLGFRHPFIGRRLMIMVPTLFVISVATFVILQLPPGDFLTSKLIELESLGTTVALEQIEDYREMYGLDDPPLVQYLKWSGLYWFTTFKEADMGLLQGDLGLSMQGERAVNDLVGDRILMTFLISLGTIIFTWSFAMPIGIYSAIRQYSVGDYVISFLGFIGMCIPNFLLAVVLMVLARKLFGVDASGLFSSKYLADPDWSLGKVWDLMQHIWLPIVVIATGSLAGMIRVMRGNLLDELKKPYVTTARAKGVRPMKLLIKYPVRLALNPFISSIGGIFPQLISGAAIVAVVLSLPTTGSLMLSALMSEDLFLAGSMLVVLSGLGVLGTLVSDLLLMVLDPRIRMEGFSR